MIKLIGEIGINHNGDLNNALKLIDIAHSAGFDYVKFQKREPEICVPEEQKSVKRRTPWGEITYLEYKKRVEFSIENYYIIDKHCKGKGIKWFASVWDTTSAETLIDIMDTVKIPSALITDLELIKFCRKNYKTVMMSTGMSTEEEIHVAVEAGNPDIIFHCNSSYPAETKELNLNYIKWLQDKYKSKQIGYSSHTMGLVTTFATVPMGVEFIEVHITLDRSMWGSDQLASVEPTGMFKLAKGVRDIEKAMKGGYCEREVYDSELGKRDVLRGSKSKDFLYLSGKVNNDNI